MAHIKSRTRTMRFRPDVDAAATAVTEAMELPDRSTMIRHLVFEKARALGLPLPPDPDPGPHVAPPRRRKPAPRGRKRVQRK